LRSSHSLAGHFESVAEFMYLLRELKPALK